MECGVPAYRPRDAEHTVLHQVIAEHLEPFLRAVAEAGDGAGLPRVAEGAGEGPGPSAAGRAALRAALGPGEGRRVDEPPPLHPSPFDSRV